ncbi:MAG: tetratricopeptide repeat protein [Myxococcota bacterium]|nr:tetratricopeptide repeat protein [Myxococcota bacterium]
MTAYSLREAAGLFGITPARLRYWERNGLVQASGSSDAGPVFGFRDLVCIKAILVLLEHGVPLRRIRRSVDGLRERIPELDQPVRSLRIWLDDSGRVVVRHDGVLLEPDGQTVIDFALAPEQPDDVTELAAARGPDPALALEWFERGCRLDASPRTAAEARRAYERAIEADPDFADAHCNLGALHQQRGDRAQARGCYERALAGDAAHVEANLNLAGLLEEAGDDEAALVRYRAALRSDPLRAETHLATALLYEKLGRDPHAREHWRRYLQTAPTGAWADVARKRLDGLP